MFWNWIVHLLQVQLCPGDAPGFVEIGEAVAADDQTTRL